MSHELIVYRVDLAAARRAVGSRDASLLGAIGERFAESLALADEVHAKESEGDEGVPTEREALRAVVDGGPFDDDHADVYLRAYELVCAFHGDLLAPEFPTFGGDLLEELDHGLVHLRVGAVSFSEFACGLPPEPLPCGDLVGYGEWSPAQCDQALAQWESSTPMQRETTSPDILADIETYCVAWIRQALVKDGHGIVGFHL